MTNPIIRYGLTSFALVSCVLTANLMADDSTSNQPGTAGDSGMTSDPAVTGEQSQSGKTDQKASNKPKDVCKSLVDAAKKEDTRAFQQWTLSSMSAQAGQAGGSANMPNSGSKYSGEQSGSIDKQAMKTEMLHKDISMLKGASCGSEHIAGTRAIVEVDKAAGEKRFLTFVQEGGLWKFDPMAFHAFYRGDMPTG